MNRPTLITLSLILILGAAVRTYRLDRPLADWHSWRQADTAAVTRRYVKEGTNLLVPKYDDLSDIPSGLDNPDGYRMVEFPLINGFIAWAYNLTDPFHSLSVHVFSRIISILFSLGSSFALFLIMLKLSNAKTALFSTFVFTFLPFNIFYSTTTLPEVSLVFFTLASTLFWVEHSLTNSFKAYLFFVLTAAIALLIKPYYIFIAPALIYIYLKNTGFKGLTTWRPYLATIFTLAPLILWRYWIKQFPSGIPASDWLFNGNHIRFTGAFFRWLFAERIGKWILGYWGLIPFGLGVSLLPHKKSGLFFHYWLAGMALYLIIFATGNVTHDYYQIFLLPIIAIFTGFGLSHLFSFSSSNLHRLISPALGLTCLLFMFAFSWFHVRDYFNINNPAIVAAGAAVDRLTPPGAKVIVPYGGDTAFLYQTNRQGWPIGGKLKQRLDQGATHYVTVNLDDEANLLKQSSRVLEQTDQYLLLELPHNLSLPQ